ncbi:MAG: rRNA small subunit methyltransferase B, partial [Microbacteriaceae bacterium]|nr:rRNA small subunit methyltransferase B [Microbacteriaceae bacterium]
ETKVIVETVLRRTDAVTRIDTSAVLAGVTKRELELGESSRDGHVQLWPHRHGTDAMFICLLEKSL